LTILHFGLCSHLPSFAKKTANSIRLQYQISQAALTTRTRHRLRYSFIGVGHRPWPWQIALLKFCNPETRLFDKAVDATIEVAAASKAPPYRGDPILPNCDTPVWGSTVFKKDHSPVGFQDSLGLIESLRGIRDRTESPCEDDRVDAAGVEWEGFFG